MKEVADETVAGGTDLRVASTLVLFDLIDRGIKHDFNRQLDIRKVAQDIDMEGIHVLKLILAFHEQYKPNVDHHRVFVYIKVRNSMEPVEAIMDIADSDWHQLMTADQLKATEKALGGGRQIVEKNTAPALRDYANES